MDRQFYLNWNTSDKTNNSYFMVGAPQAAKEKIGHSMVLRFMVQLDALRRRHSVRYSRCDQEFSNNFHMLNT